jgi:hypothetical protein
MYSLKEKVELHEIEEILRSDNMNVHLIAQVKEVPDTMTIVDLQGRGNRKYVVGFYFSAEPRRRAIKASWPKSPEENIERLKEAGLVMDAFKMKCIKCKGRPFLPSIFLHRANRVTEFGHIAKKCTAEAITEPDRPKIECINCREEGHRARDCPKERFDPTLCHNCKQSGHKSSDCTEPRDIGNIECRKCNQIGHFSRDCPSANDVDRACHNCGEEGHFSKDCEKPYVMKCRNCDQEGHIARDCSEPKNKLKNQCRNCDEFGHFSK